MKSATNGMLAFGVPVFLFALFFTVYLVGKKTRLNQRMWRSVQRVRFTRMQ